MLSNDVIGLIILAASALLPFAWMLLTSSMEAKSRLVESDRNYGERLATNWDAAPVTELRVDEPEQRLAA